MPSLVRREHLEPVPCLCHADHRAPKGAKSYEPILCAGCNREFLREIHQPSVEESILLSLLTYFSLTDDPKMYKIAKQELYDLRGQRYCSSCRFSPKPISERVQ